MRHFAAVFFGCYWVGIGHAQTFEIGGFRRVHLHWRHWQNSITLPQTIWLWGVLNGTAVPVIHSEGSIVLANIEGNDGDSPETRRKERGYSFKNSIAEVSAESNILLGNSTCILDIHKQVRIFIQALLTFIYNALYKGADNIIRIMTPGLLCHSHGSGC